MKKILSFILILSLIIVCSACGDDASNVSKIPLDDYYENSAYANTQTPLESNNDSSVKNPQSSKVNNNSSKNNSKTSNENSSFSQNTTSTVNNNVVNNNTTTSSATVSSTSKKDVNILIPRNYTKQEQVVVDNYQKTYGIKINTTVATSGYDAKMVSLISQGKSPDIVLFGSENFPGTVTSALQPINDYLSKTSGNLNSVYMDAFKINNKIFGLAKKDNWFNDGQNYVIYYNAKIFKDAGVTTPYQLYKEGKWNWESQREALMKLKNANKIYTIGFQQLDLMMLSAGVDFVSYDSYNANFVCNIGELNNTSLITKAWMEMVQFRSDDYLATDDIFKNFNNGTLALLGAATEGMCRDFGWFNDFKGGVNNIEAVPFAGPKGKNAYTPVKARCFGIPKKAKNPDGAIAFLNYFLESSNYNITSDIYHTQFQSVFNGVNSSTNRRKISYSGGIVSANYNSNEYHNICNRITISSYGNVANTINNHSDIKQIKSAMSKCNKNLQRFKD